MMNKYLLAVSAAFLLAASQSSVFAGSPGAPAADPAMISGRLANGLRYVLMPSHLPADPVSLLLQVQAGSEEETGTQLGAAHLLEHLVFGSTAHYPAGQMETELRRLGLPLNVHRYAEPALDQTVYKLDLPDAKPATLATGLKILADWAGGMSLLPAEVEEQRDSVAAELKRHVNADERMRQVIAEATFMGTVIGERPPMGRAETIQTLSPASVKEFYQTWYRPDSMTLIVAGGLMAGGLDADSALSRIKEGFGSLAARAPSHPKPDLTTLAVTSRPVFVTRTEDGAAGTEVLIQRTMALPPVPDTLGWERDDLCRRVARDVFRRRVETLVADDRNSPVIDADLILSEDHSFSRAGVHAYVRRKGEALRALAWACVEYRRLLEYGPTDAELAEERRSVAAALDAEAAQADQRSGATLAGEIQTASETGRVLMSPSQRRDLLKPMLGSISRDEVLAALKAFGSPPGRDVVAVVGQEDLGGSGGQSVREAYARALALPVSAPAAGAVSVWAYGDPPQPSGVQWLPETPDEAAQGIKALWSRANGLRIQARRSTSEPGRVYASLRFEIADQKTSRSRPAGVGELIERGLAPGGLGQHSAAEVAALFAGSSVRFTGVRVSDDAITYTACCRGDDLVRALQLLRAYYGDPGWRPEAESAVKRAWLDSLAAQSHDVDAQAERRMQTALVGADTARRPAASTEVRALTFKDASRWLEKALDNAKLTVTVVGDAPEDAVDTAALWFGQYRVNDHFMVASTADVVSSIPQAPPVKPGVERFSISGRTAKAQVRVLWPTDDTFDISRTHRLDLLACCLGERLQTALRAKLGKTASARAWSTASETFRHEGAIRVSAGVAPDQADRALAIIRAEAAALVKGGVGGEQLARFKAAAVESALADRNSSVWWLSTVLPYACWQPFRIYWSAHIVQDYRSVTAAQVNALARRYLVNARTFAVIGISRPKHASRPRPLS